jgi:hypothetical protein
MTKLLSRPLNAAAIAALFAWAAMEGSAGSFRLVPPAPDIDRWMYSFNAMPGLRPAAPIFSTFGDESGVDTRHGQFIMAWNTAATIPPGADIRRYQLRSVRLTVQSIREGTFVNDSTPDTFETYLFAEHPSAIPDADPGRPFELFGTGFRGPFTNTPFLANSPFGSSAAGGRNAFAAGFNPRGELVDVGNNVGKRSEDFAPFPSRPFAFSRIEGVEQGAPVPAGTDIRFELDLTDPLVLGYIRNALVQGRLWLTLTWLGGSEGLGGMPTYPDIATAENLVFTPPRLVLEGTYVGDADTDNDGLPDDWERHHYGNLDRHAEDDTDLDGMAAIDEWRADSSPTTPDALRITRESGPAGTVVLSWLLLPNRRHKVESSVDLISWKPAEGTFDFAGKSRLRWTSSGSETDTAFFRVRLVE